MNPRDFVEIKYGQWWEQVPQKATKKKHARNVKACLDAVDYHNQKDRPLNVLLIHGSGRSSFRSAAQELSNSQLLLRSAVVLLATWFGLLWQVNLAHPLGR